MGDSRKRGFVMTERGNGGNLKCAVCGKPVEQVKPCGYYRWHGQVTCDEYCEKCFQEEPFPCRDHDGRMKERSEE